MGCCWSFFGGSSAKDSDEARSFLMKKGKIGGQEGLSDDGAVGDSNFHNRGDFFDASNSKGPKYYQAIIDEANCKFLNAPSQFRKKTLNDTDIIRSSLLTLNSSIANSPPSAVIIARNCNPDIVNNNRSVVNALSESVVMSDRFDAAVR